MPTPVELARMPAEALRVFAEHAIKWEDYGTASFGSLKREHLYAAEDALPIADAFPAVVEALDHLVRACRTDYMDAAGKPIGVRVPDKAEVDRAAAALALLKAPADVAR